MHKILHKFTKILKNRAKIRITYLVFGISQVRLEKTKPI